MKPSNCMIGALVALGIGGAIPRATANLLPLDGTWTVVDEVPTGAGGFAFDRTWTIESAAVVELSVSDLYVPGDIFEISVNGLVLGQTSPFDSRYLGAWADTPEDAILDGAFSYAKWLIQPGLHSINIRNLQRPGLFSNDPSTVGINAREIPVPVPESGSTWTLLSASMAGLIGLRRLPARRKSPASTR